ncbi:MAG: FAD/NAD(P)-binding protein [Gemmatimonadota bacterium]|nr:MAG: FAD/NAD(P)-binding protein [Gemmatimonadota bacterium]
MDSLFLPGVARILDVRDETPDTKTFRVVLRDRAAHDGFEFQPGQFVELSVFGCGEAPFCIASSPTRPEYLELTVRRAGQLTDALHRLGAGDEIGLRGPCGNGFDVAAAAGKDLVFVGGGIGLPPLRGLIWNVLDQRERFDRVTVLYGARTPNDLVYKDELKRWAERSDVEVLVTVDRGEPGWDGIVGMVPVLFDRTELHPRTSLAFVCGPPVMITFVIQDLLMRGFADHAIISTLERMMQCGVGKCNHCAIGHRYVCRDGPVFSYSQIKELVE